MSGNPRLDVALGPHQAAPDTYGWREPSLLAKPTNRQDRHLQALGNLVNVQQTFHCVLQADATMLGLPTL